MLAKLLQKYYRVKILNAAKKPFCCKSLNGCHLHDIFLHSKIILGMLTAAYPGLTTLEKSKKHVLYSTRNIHIEAHNISSA